MIRATVLASMLLMGGCATKPQTQAEVVADGPVRDFTIREIASEFSATDTSLARMAQDREIARLRISSPPYLYPIRPYFSPYPLLYPYAGRYY